MASITTINSTDLITNSRTDLNNNFDNLNTDKIETSVIDTDTTLAANSDTKLPSQKAVKAYVDAGGNVNATETSKGIVELATTAEVVAGTDIGGTGASLAVVPSEMNTQIDAKIAASGADYASGTTTHDISTTTTTTIAHGLASIPTYIKISSAFSSASNFAWTEATYVDSTQSAIYSSNEISSDVASGEAFRIYEDTSSPRYITGTITADATNISISWSKTGSPSGTAPLLWVAQK